MYKPRKGEASSEKISVYRFPKDPHQKEKWLKGIKRMDNVEGKSIPFIPNDGHRVCAVHFSCDDFLTESCDRESRQALRGSLTLKTLRRKPNAIPSIFPSYPVYFTCTSKKDKQRSSGEHYILCASCK